jgi:hypothetical protein
MRGVGGKFCPAQPISSLVVTDSCILGVHLFLLLCLKTCSCCTIFCR